ncbi:PD-(D/E)XK nuclease family protein [Paenibacillus sp. PvR148]
MTRKVLLVDRFADGQQWLQQVCRDHGRVLNVEPQTIESLALKQAGLQLFQQGMCYLRSGQTFWIVQQLMTELAEEGSTYISQTLLTPGMAACVHRSVTDLRSALVLSADLRLDMFMDERKGHYLKELLNRYECYLAKHHYADLASLVTYIEPDTDSVVYILPEKALRAKSEQVILKTIAGGRLVLVERERSFTEPTSGFPVEKAEFFHAAGTLAEVREVLRRIHQQHIPLDQVEIISSDMDSYIGPIHTMALELGMPCTYSGGLPLPYSRAGWTLLAALDWVELDFPVSRFISMLRGGGISLRKRDEGVSGSDWIRWLERLNIGWGKERYLLLLDPERCTEKEEIHRVELLRSLFIELLSPLPDDDKGWSPLLVLRWLHQLMSTYGVIHNEEDASVIKALEDSMETLGMLGTAPMSKAEALQYAREQLARFRTHVSATPRPGFLHISSLANGGLSGRPYTFLIGMDERSWSSSSRQDPVLLDEERHNISGELTLAAEHSLRDKQERNSRLGMIRGQVTLSYCSYQLSEGKPASPAFELLQLFRTQQQLPKADFSAVHDTLGLPVGYLSTKGSTPETALPLDASDLWSHELAMDGGRLRNGKHPMEAAYPFIGQGSRAKACRESMSITGYDGWVQAEGASSLPQVQQPIAYSASQLERYAECPMKYYFSYVLGMWPKEAAVYDRTRWLAPADRGSLLHRIFFEYLKKITIDGAVAPQHDNRILRSVTEFLLCEAERMVPAPSLHIFQKESDEIRRDVEWFLQEETAKTALPRYFEQELSLNGEPLEIVLEDGSSVLLRGFVDRIDQIAPHQYRIIDYKTGSPSKYREHEYFAGGTQLQHALYALAAEQWLKESGKDPEARVTESAYYFPTAKGIGREVVRLQDRRGELAQVVLGLLHSMELGIYIPTQDTKRCRYCDYAEVCGSHASLMGEKKENPEHRELLKSLLEVEKVD